MIIGVWVMALLFLGFPSSWDKILYVITGLIIVIMAYNSKPEISEPASNVPFEEYRSNSKVNSDSPITKSDSLPN